MVLLSLSISEGQKGPGMKNRRFRVVHLRKFTIKTGLLKAVSFSVAVAAHCLVGKATFKSRRPEPYYVRIAGNPLSTVSVSIV